MFVSIEIITIFDAEKTQKQNERHVLRHIFYINRIQFSYLLLVDYQCYTL